MPWITVDLGLVKHPKIAELPNDSARYGWIVTLCEAKIQRRPGTFSSDRHYRQVLGRYAKYLPNYIAARLLERDEDGALHVHDWRRHQWAVAQARHRDDGSVTEGGHQEDASRAVPVPVSVSRTEGGAAGGKPPDTWELYCGLTGASRPSPNVVQWLTKLEDRYGAGPMVEAMTAEWGDGQERRTFLSRVEHRLEKAAREAEKASQLDIRNRRIQEQMQSRRLEWFRNTGKWEAEWGPMPQGVAS